jgi:alkylated DNA repair protein alkB family protein 6
MKALALETICENPPLILYSPTTFVTHDNNATSSSSSSSSSSLPLTALEDWLRQLPSGDSGLGEWKTMNYGKRRVCMFGEEEQQQQVTGGAHGPSMTTMAVLPPPLLELAQELVTRGIFPPSAPPNHVLLNEYQPGQGIMPHTDGPMYENCTATLSLTSSVVMEFTKRWTEQEQINNPLEMPHTTQTPPESSPSSSCSSPLKVLLQPGSLLVFQDDAYINYCHGIVMNVWQDVITNEMACLNAKPTADNQTVIVPRGLRYSLTFRHKKW